MHQATGEWTHNPWCQGPCKNLLPLTTADITTTTTTTILQPFVRDYPGESVPEGLTILDFAEARDDGVAVASAEPYASY